MADPLLRRIQSWIIGLLIFIGFLFAYLSNPLFTEFTRHELINVLFYKNGTQQGNPLASQKFIEPLKDLNIAGSSIEETQSKVPLHPAILSSNTSSSIVITSNRSHSIFNFIPNLLDQTGCPQCKPALVALVDKYFSPHLSGITKDIIDDAFLVRVNISHRDSVVLVQVINGTIYADLKRMDSHPWLTSRLNFIISRLQEFVNQRRNYCKENQSLLDKCLPDFEFVTVGLFFKW